MCGIAGGVSVDSSPELRRIIESIVADQIRRGPDRQAVEDIRGAGVQVVLGHDRLAIIDLSAQADQPMWDVGHRRCIVFNGEIYNHVELRAELIELGHTFRTKSDTEVILEAFARWGTDAIRRFNGMFAFALYDAQQQKVMLVRDRFGVKPLYYHRQGGRLVFASTARELARQLKLAPCLTFVARGVQSGVYEDDSDRTPYEQLKSVLPSHWVEVSLKRDLSLEVHRYYDLEARVAELRERTHQMAVSGLLEMASSSFASAVDLRLRSDVPVGISLSAGLDSSMVAAFLSERHDEIIGFTFGSPDDPASEGPTVARTARELGLEVEFIRPTSTDLLDAFWTSLSAQDAPFGGGSIIAQYLVYGAARRRGVRVVLGGQGADEIFMGYLKFQFFFIKELARQHRFGKLVASGLGLLSRIASDRSNLAVYWRRRHAYVGRSVATNGVNWPPERRALGYDAARPLWTRQMQDAVSLSLPTLLRYDDRSSMANSVESRMPFLDYRIVELGLAVPEDVKVRHGFGKWIVREIGRGKVPDHVRLSRTKSHFNVRHDDWIAAGLGGALRQRLHDGFSSIRLLVDDENKIDGLFSDDRLRHHPNAFHEAIALAWLGSHAS